jgi:ubiquinone/menaquinone biosynthesis C-methylase UbiE
MGERIDLLEQRQRDRAATFAAAVVGLVRPQGDERVLDVGSGLGALAFVLAPHVREVVAVEPDPERVARARAIADAEGIGNVTLRVGDGRRLVLADGEFDVAGTTRTLHHVDRPDLVLAELARVTRRGGTVLVVDQLGPADAAEAARIDEFERARDPSHSRALPDAELRRLFDANGLEVVRARFVPESRDLEPYLDLAGCSGAARDRARTLAPGGRAPDITVGWYLLRRRRT